MCVCVWVRAPLSVAGHGIESVMILFRVESTFSP